MKTLNYDSRIEDLEWIDHPYYRCGNFKSYGKNVTIYPLAKIIFQEHLSIGNSVIIDDFVFIAIHGSIGDFVHIASFVSITGRGTFIMKDFTSLATGCRVLTGNEDWHGNYLNNPTVPLPYRNAKRSTTIMENHATLGANCVVMPGVTIGEGALIGAGSLVMKDCEPWSVYVGAPARKVKEYSPETILSIERKLREEFYKDGIYQEAVVRGLPESRWQR